MTTVLAYSACRWCWAPAELLAEAIPGYKPIWNHARGGRRFALCDEKLWATSGRTIEGYRAAGGRTVEPAVRTVERSGLVYQEGHYGPRLVGQLHYRPSGRWHVVMAGRKVAMRLRTRTAAVAVALEWKPTTDDDADVLSKLLDPTIR